MINYIYALIDPIDKSIRYIGRTAYLKIRYAQHLKCEINTEKYKWIKSLLDIGLKPEIEVIYQCAEGENSHSIEQDFISEYINQGVVLYNHINKQPTNFNFHIMNGNVYCDSKISKDSSIMLINYILKNTEVERELLWKRK
jgi:hypothetical protein